nr:hypothetical protein [Tanacetum cinerariifolium]
MMSRAKNYLEDQLLGFALVPLSDIIIENGKLNKEFTLSSSDVFHSPSGFVELTLSYNGVSPDVFAISRPMPPSNTNVSIVSDQCELDKLEFPDPKIVNENEMMVSEYIGICSESLGSSDTDDQASSENGTSVLDNHKPVSPPTSVSTNGSHCPSAPTASSESADQESDSPPKEKPAVSDSLDKLEVNTGLDEKVIQQDFVDLYMKSMQQFTESLAKMNLPVDMEMCMTRWLPSKHKKLWMTEALFLGGSFSIHDTFHVSNLKKCLADPTLHVPLEVIQVDAKLNFVEEPVKILEREIKKLTIPIVKVRWNSKRGPEFTWERLVTMVTAVNLYFF